MGITAYLTKPLTQPELWEAIQMVLSQQRATAESTVRLGSRGS